MSDGADQGFYERQIESLRNERDGYKAGFDLKSAEVARLTEQLEKEIRRADELYSMNVSLRRDAGKPTLSDEKGN